VPKEKKRALVIDLISDSSDEDDDTSITQSSSKKQAISVPSKLQASAHSAISSTSDSPELMIIDLE
jgi:hypothetical protein